MLLSRNVLVIVVALVVSARTTSSNVTRGSDVYDPDSIPQNEKLLRLLLRLASHTASRLIHLKKEAKLRDASTRGAVEPAVRINFSPSVNGEVLSEDSKVKPMEIASRMFLNDDKNNNSASDVKENAKNATGSGSESEAKSPAQSAKSVISNAGGSGSEAKSPAQSAKSVISNTAGSGVGQESGSGSGAKSPAQSSKPVISNAGGSGVGQASGSGSGATSPAQSAKPVISNAGGSGVGHGSGSGAKNPAQGVISAISNAGGSGIVNQAVNATSSLGSGGKTAMQGLRSVVEGSGVARQALNIATTLQSNGAQGAGAKTNAAQGIESVISAARQEVAGKILQPVERALQEIVRPDGLMGSLPLFRSFPAARDEPSTPKNSEGQTAPKKSTETTRDPKSRNPSAKNPTQVSRDKIVDNANLDEVSELELKGFALQFADALRPVKSRRR